MGKSFSVFVVLNTTAKVLPYKDNNSFYFLVGHSKVSPLIGASLSESHTGGSRFNRGTVVTFPKVYETNTESPTLVVVDSTVVRWSRFQKFTKRTRKAPHWW